MESVLSQDFTVNAAPPAGATATYEDAILGDVVHYFSYLKVMDNIGSAGQKFHLYNGCVVSDFTISSGESGSLTYTASIVGKDRTRPGAMPAGNTNLAGAYQLLTADKVIGLDDGTHDLTTDCYKGFTLTINSNAEGNVCIGTAGNKSIDPGDVTATLETSLKYKDDQYSPLFDAATETSVHVGAKATDNSYWDFDASRALVTSAPVNLPGKGEPFIISAVFSVLNDDTAAADLLKMGVDKP
jgi:hypothetical protein